MKAISLPINVLVIVALAAIVMLGLIAMYFTGFRPFTTTVSLEGVKNEACRVLVQEKRCAVAINTIQTPNFDADNDGIPGETAALGDNLDFLCANYYNLPIDSECKQMCGCP